MADAYEQDGSTWTAPSGLTGRGCAVEWSSVAGLIGSKQHNILSIVDCRYHATGISRDRSSFSSGCLIKS